MHILKLTTAITATALLSACGSLHGPDYQRPQTPEKQDWSLNASSTTAAAAEDIRPDWWAVFGDAQLNRLVRQALSDSPDIRNLATRVEAAGIGLDLERANNRPTLSLGTSSSFTDSQDGSSRSYGANLQGLSWELDLWGKVRKGVRAQQAEFKASEADYRAGYLTLVAAVAENYFQLRELDERIATQENSLKQGQRILGIYRMQLREGVVAQTKLLQQQAEINDLKQQLLDLQRARTVNENRLAVLVGAAAGEFSLAPAPLSGTLRAPIVPAGLPATLLQRRPDIVAAEYRVLKAYELVGKARLSKLPTIKLTGSGGLSSAVLSGLLNSWTLGLGLAVNIPIFDPKLDLDIKASELRQQAAAEDYRKAVLVAFEEVESGLTNLASRREQVRELSQRIANLEVVNQQVRAQLAAGIVSQLEVLESERSLLTARQTLLQLQHQILRDTVTLYKTLGGGWPLETVQLADSQES